MFEQLANFGELIGGLGALAALILVRQLWVDTQDA